MLIKPVTIRLIAYGQKANIAAIRGRAADLLKEEHGAVDDACLAPASAADLHAEIIAARWDDEIPLKKPTASQSGLVIILAEVNERLTTEWLYELPVAKTCVAFATWISAREPVSWQLLIAEGRRWSENRPMGG
ncbi:MAG: hypothetical protein H0W83_00460 [Planctomycetes bacterium]|nr:hypothetical protein [Planctomycetota bacterium]